jgi:hypothetical protein
VASLPAAPLHLLFNTPACASLLQAATLPPDIPSSSQVLLGRKGSPGSSSSSKPAAPLHVFYNTPACSSLLQAATLPPDIRPSSQVLLGRKGSPGSSSSSKPAAPLQGVVEVGGASLQVTFAAKEQLPPGQAAGLVLPRLGADRLYSRSFDGLGLQVRLVVAVAMPALQCQSLSFVMHRVPLYSCNCGVCLGGYCLQASMQQLLYFHGDVLLNPAYPKRVSCCCFVCLQAAMEQWSARLAADGSSSSKHHDPCLPSGYSDFVPAMHRRVTALCQLRCAEAPIRFLVSQACC